MTVGIVGSESLADLVAAALGRPDLAVGEAGEVTAERPDWIVAEGTGALRELVRSGVDAPVLVIESNTRADEWPSQAIPTVPRADLGAAIEAASAGELPETARTPIVVAVDGSEAGRALFDVTLVTDEPARICEYSVRTGHEAVGSVRADGIVVATPAGSYGYASAAGGPILESGTGVVAVVPIAAFVTDADHWVLDADDVELGVEREETIAVVADGDPIESIERGDGVELTPGESVWLFEWSG